MFEPSTSYLNAPCWMVDSCMARMVSKECLRASLCSLSLSLSHSVSSSLSPPPLPSYSQCSWWGALLPGRSAPGGPRQARPKFAHGVRAWRVTPRAPKKHTKHGSNNIWEILVAKNRSENRISSRKHRPDVRAEISDTPVFARTHRGKKWRPKFAFRNFGRHLRREFWAPCSFFVGEFWARFCFLVPLVACQRCTSCCAQSYPASCCLPEMLCALGQLYPATCCTPELHQLLCAPVSCDSYPATCCMSEVHPRSCSSRANNTSTRKTHQH